MRALEKFIVGEPNSLTGTAGNYLSGINLIAVGDAAICAVDSSNQLSSGGSHTCAANSAGALYCWGYGAYGALGNGTSGTLAVPTQVKINGTTNLSGVASVVAFGNKNANGTSTCALTAAGAVYCWGSNSFGQVGVNGTENASTYTYAYPLPSLTSGVLSLSAVSDGVTPVSTISLFGP